jgi:hypothetical protein
MGKDRHERLTRVNYQGTSAETSRFTQDADFADYVAPLWREHHGALHGAGVAAGLGVTLNAAGTGLVVAAGAAIDGTGRLVVLADDGRALAGAPAVETAVPVEVFPPGGLAGKWAVLTLQFTETARPPSDSFPAGRLEHTPLLRLVAADGFTASPGVIVLAVALVGADGKVGHPQASWPGHPSVARQRVMTANAGGLILLAPGEVGGQVAQAAAAELRPDDPGASLAVPEGPMSIDAKEIRLTGVVPAILRRQYHGAVDIDPDMPHVMRLHFEDAARVPERVKLFLRGARFSRAFYTDLGLHSHLAEAAPVDLSHSHAHNIQVTGDGAHTHSVGTGNANGAGKPWNYNWSGSADAGQILSAWHVLGGQIWNWSSIFPGGPSPPNERGTYTVTTTGHGHGIGGGGGIAAALGAHSYAVTVAPAGVPVRAEGHLKEYLADLRVLIAGHDVTARILAKLAGWAQLGDGTAGHALVAHGTGVLDVTDLVPLSPGSPEVRFEVAAGGGRLLYDVICE